MTIPHLHEDQRVGVEHDQVDLTTAAAVIPVDESQTLALEEGASFSLHCVADVSAGVSPESEVHRNPNVRFGPAVIMRAATLETILRVGMFEAFRSSQRAERVPKLAALSITP